MIFHITYQLSPERRTEAQGRFKQTGALPPAGVTMLDAGTAWRVSGDSLSRNPPMRWLLRSGSKVGQTS